MALSPLQLLLLLVPVVNLVVAVLVARDIRKRGGDSVAAWAIGTLVLGLPLALVYALARPKA